MCITEILLFLLTCLLWPAMVDVICALLCFTQLWYVVYAAEGVECVDSTFRSVPLCFMLHLSAGDIDHAWIW